LVLGPRLSLTVVVSATINVDGKFIPSAKSGECTVTAGVLHLMQFIGYLPFDIRWAKGVSSLVCLEGLQPSRIPGFAKRDGDGTKLCREF
jgi:hypothetical protein